MYAAQLITASQPEERRRSAGRSRSRKKAPARRGPDTCGIPRAVSTSRTLVPRNPPPPATNTRCTIQTSHSHPQRLLRGLGDDAEVLRADDRHTKWVVRKACGDRRILGANGSQRRL